MKLGFEKIMEDYDIDIDDLPRDLQVVIEDLQTSKSHVIAKRNIGNTISDSTIERIRVKDQMVVRELLELIDEQEVDDSDDDSDDEYDNDEYGNDDSEDDSEEEYNIYEEDNDRDELMVDGATALAVEKELHSLYSNGIRTVSLTELRSKARNAYNLLWDSYESNEENGIATSNYELIETEINSEEFNLIKL